MTGITVVAFNINGDTLPLTPAYPGGEPHITASDLMVPAMGSEFDPMVERLMIGCTGMLVLRYYGVVGTPHKSNLSIVEWIDKYFPGDYFTKRRIREFARECLSEEAYSNIIQRSITRLGERKCITKMQWG